MKQTTTAIPCIQPRCEGVARRIPDPAELVEMIYLCGTCGYEDRISGRVEVRE